MGIVRHYAQTVGSAVTGYFFITYRMERARPVSQIFLSSLAKAKLRITLDGMSEKNFYNKEQNREIDDPA
ncbi:hypothetical protein LJC23_05205 [Desulfovibrio sp. OttesenSCG-928-I05]|nr:hypothetical protein [Desulfovibrio sp. OttesenSCG-928-I05]